MAKAFKTTSAKTEYFDSCIDSYINGQKAQGRAFFIQLSKVDRKELCLYIEHSDVIGEEKQNLYRFFFSML